MNNRLASNYPIVYGCERVHTRARGPYSFPLIPNDRNEIDNLLIERDLV